MDKKGKPMRGDRLKLIREFRQLTQRELAARCDLGEKQIWRYENGMSDPGSEHVIAIAKALNVSADYLLGLSDDHGIRISEESLTPMERKLIDAVRNGFIVEALRTFTTLTERGEQSDVATDQQPVHG